ncbi:hypothetical protein ETB97_005821 [Aspergillus alliaceus]|uniref:Uncharacterized protein n=1 Tax=Petromyces alliaceus TaxID=209559 RepID=A0A8H6ADS9_PETAA|nr:hypothetical protein ETB97_005821 [Aspergillus burnettii]
MNFTVAWPSLHFLIGGASFVLTTIVTLLDGLCLRSFKHLSSNIRSIESAVLVLNVVSCVALAVATLSRATDTKNDNIGQSSGWRRRVYCVTVVYLAVAIGVTAGGIAWSTAQVMTESKRMPLSSSQRLLMIIRTVIWAIFVLAQGLLGGLLLMMTLAKQMSRSRCSSSLSHDLETLQEQLVVDYRQGSAKSQLITESRKNSADQKWSCDGLTTTQPSTASLISKRYSGRTLYQQDSKHGSLELYPPLSYPECVVMRGKVGHCPNKHDSCPAGTVRDAGLRKAQENVPEIKCSLDTLRRQSSLRRSTDTWNSLQSEVPSRSAPPKVQLSDESNIHPLFRSNSPTPPPTAMPGTTVIASPAAGQTISIKALYRMRSTHSLQSYIPRSRSPLFERIDQADEAVRPKQGPAHSRGGLNRDQSSTIPSFVIAADLRRSITQYEKRYELIETPHES